MSILLTVVLSCIVPAQEALAPDEIYISKLGFAAQKDDRVLFSVMKRITPELYLFDFKTGKARLIQDGRMTFFIPFILSDEQGFLVVPAVGSATAHHLDREGNYLSRTDFRKFKNRPQSARIRHIQTARSQVLTATMEDSAAGKLLLVEIDMEREEVRVLHAEAKPEFLQFWVLQGDTWYRITQETGEIVTVDPGRNFMPDKVIRRKMEPVARPKGTAGRFPYLMMLNRAVHHSDEIFFRLGRLRDRFGNLLEEPVYLSLVLSAGKLRETPYLTLGKSGGKALSYVWEDQELLLHTP
ncbi:MAG: hypothetical protein QNK37_16200 [Acidobacteriota bacterium]|nr:hypothetical protein [Acidobacteriota bacterium]